MPVYFDRSFLISAYPPLLQRLTSRTDSKNLLQSSTSIPEATYKYENFTLDEKVIQWCGGRARAAALHALPPAALHSAESLNDAEPMARRTKHEIAAAQR